MREREIPEGQKASLVDAKRKEWDKMLKSEALRVHVGKDAEEKVKEFGRERLLQSCFVITQPDDPEQRRQGVFKARRCIRGYLDPDVLELSTSSPTLSSEGLSTSLQLLSSFRWEAIIADIEAAFLRADPLQRRVLVRVPHGGIPGVDDGRCSKLLAPDSQEVFASMSVKAE